MDPEPGPDFKFSQAFKTLKIFLTKSAKNQVELSNSEKLISCVLGEELESGDAF